MKKTPFKFKLAITCSNVLIALIVSKFELMDAQKRMSSAHGQHNP